MATLTFAGSGANGPRPVSLKTDLAPLADLMEIAFADSMDSGGRAAIREMRAFSRLGPGVGVLSSVNDLVQGIGLGYVWMHDGRLVGNVSIYPASLPSHLPRAYVIANVAVHPDFRKRGIARQLMLTSLDAVGSRGDVLLQVEERNEPARTLYDSLGFETQETFTTWKRPSAMRRPPPLEPPAPYITRRGSREWADEMALAARVRPAAMGGIGWLRPIDQHFFRRSPGRAISDFFNLRSLERLIIRSEDGSRIAASLWIERAFGASTTQLTLLVDEPHTARYGDALLNTAVRRFDGEALTIEHPAHDPIAGFLLQRYSFQPQRTLVHMRLPAQRATP